MPTLDYVARPYNVSPFQFSMLPNILAYATGITSDFSINSDSRCTHIHPKPSLKKRLLCLAGIFGLIGTIIQPENATTYFKTESPIAKAGLLANIGPNGVDSSGAKSGIVIASPNTNDPNYLNTWVRDSSLVFKVIVDRVTSGRDPDLFGQIVNFTAAEAELQQTTNPSGTVFTGGLGEPKFDIDGTAFTGSWGRPQRDGPALRSTTWIAYANWLLRLGNHTIVADVLWPVIKLDLDYVATWWNQTTFDLWEEVRSSSFFTSAVQHRALREGAALAAQLGQTTSADTYTTQATNVLCFLQSYWNPTGGYITANTGGGRSGKDSNTILASIHTWDIDAGCDAATFQPCSDKALSNLKVYVDSFRSLYPINQGINASFAVAVGRYPEDTYTGKPQPSFGNPWYLSTFAVAEQLYDAVLTWESVGFIDVTDVSLDFFRQFAPNIRIGRYYNLRLTKEFEFWDIIRAVKQFADGFIEIAAKYTPSDGSLAEQFDRQTGAPTSARDLTWSYASALTAGDSFSGVKPVSWGAKGLVVPSTCTPFPGPIASVTFDVQAFTRFGENIYLTGSVDGLEIWSANDALLLSPEYYPIWTITLDLPASTYIEYKYIRKIDGRVQWEADPNNKFTTPENGSITLHDEWR
ncbi:glucoamylase [Lactifluus volemus]|nr:glucoamylase [Lactifluus volemus]